MTGSLVGAFCAVLDMISKNNFRVEYLIISIGFGAFLGGPIAIFFLPFLNFIDQPENDRHTWPYRTLLFPFPASLVGVAFFYTWKIAEKGISSFFFQSIGFVILFCFFSFLLYTIYQWCSKNLIRKYCRFLPSLNDPKTNTKWILTFSSITLLILSTIWFRTDLSLIYGPLPPFILGSTVLLFPIVYLLVSKYDTLFFLRYFLVVFLLPTTVASLLTLELSSKNVAKKIVSSSLVASYPLQGLWAITDRDGDGFSPLFGGIDCNDTNKDINPNAVDLPGNGVDENCSGLDAKIIGELPHLKSITPGDGPAKNMNLLLITSEAFRADYLYNKKTALPNISRLASHSVDFRHAFSCAPATHLSLPCMLRGRYPSGFQWNLDKAPIIEMTDPGHSLPELFQKQGYNTSLYANKWVIDNVSQIKHGFNNVFSPQNKDAPSNGLVDLLADNISSQSEDTPFFFWIHIHDPHIPYIGSYKDELKRVDSYILKILNALHTSKRTNNTVIVFSSDHAEALFEHGVVTHSSTVYNSEVHVPLIIHIPGIPSARCQTPVTLADLTPTIVDALGLKSTEKYEGQSLLPLLRACTQATSARLIFIENYIPYLPHKRDWIGVVWKKWKLVDSLLDNRVELYDFIADPKEKNNLAGVKKDLAESLRLEATLFRTESRSHFPMLR